MCKEYSPEDNDFVEICPEEWQTIADDENYKTFELWENLQNLHKETLKLLSKGFIEKIILSDVREIKLIDGEIKPTVFIITEEEIDEIVNDMVEEEILGKNLKLSKKQIVEVLSCIEGDEFLAKDIRTSIRGSVLEVLDK